MKISKILVPIVVLSATAINNNQVKAGVCEDRCSEAFHYGIDQCTATSLPWLVLGCYAGCGIFYASCMGACAALK